MKRPTNAFLTAQLNEIARERDDLLRRAQGAEAEAGNLARQLVWHKNTNQQLMDILLAGAKEGTFPRRPA